jgi:hypothetical protein
MHRAAYYIRNILTDIVARRGERGERRLVVHANNARLHTAKVTRAFYDDNFLRIAPHPSYSPELAPAGVRKILDDISVNTLEAVFGEWINRLDRCITLQQMESTWNEINSHPLGCSWQRSDLEMTINGTEMISRSLSGILGETDFLNREQDSRRRKSGEC